MDLNKMAKKTLCNVFLQQSKSAMIHYIYYFYNINILLRKSRISVPSCSGVNTNTTICGDIKSMLKYSISRKLKRKLVSDRHQQFHQN